MTRTTGVAIVTALLAIAGCSGHRSSGRVLPAERGGAPVVYAAIGTSETVGEGTDNPTRDSWPQVLFRTALPPAATFVNFGTPGVTLATALNGELPEALEVQPNLVTVWLNVTDLLNGVAPATYEAQLRSLLSQLRAEGAEVLVANTPPVEDLPVYAACRDPSTAPDQCPPGVAQPVPSPTAVEALVASYNSAIARAAGQTGAVVVDLHAADVAARAAGHEAALISSDGLDPSVAGAAVIAAKFATALHAAGPLPPLRPQPPP